MKIRGGTGQRGAAEGVVRNFGELVDIFLGRTQKKFPERAAFEVVAPGGTCARYATADISICTSDTDTRMQVGCLGT